jgi:hypothetical protein
LISENPQKYKELNYKYCCECKKVLCLECREKHDKCNPKHSLMDDLIEFNSNCISHIKKSYHIFAKIVLLIFVKNAKMLIIRII